MNSLTVAVCTYNRALRLSKLVRALRQQECPIPFEILIVDNNSTDGTQSILNKLSAEHGPPLRFVKEKRQGIVFARNRALDESLDSTYLAFLDDDELPLSGMLKAAVDALEREGADCVGGRIKIFWGDTGRPAWLGDELPGFLGEVDYGNEAFWVTNSSTIIWSGNVAYRTTNFTDGLRFDPRYNRRGHGIGGGEDAIMFHSLLGRGVRIRYRPDMAVEHFIEDWKLKRSYFLKLHFVSGYKTGRWELIEHPRLVCGVPPFLFAQAIRHWAKTVSMTFRGKPGVLRQAMTAMHAMGMIAGTFQRCRDKKV